MAVAEPLPHLRLPHRLSLTSHTTGNSFSSARLLLLLLTPGSKKRPDDWPGVARPDLRPSSALDSLSLSPSLGFPSVNSGVEGRELRSCVYRQGTPSPVHVTWAAGQWQLCPLVAPEGERPFTRSLTCSPCGIPEAHRSTF